MRNVLLWLCLALPLLGISQTSQADVIFRLDLNDVAIQDSIPEPIQAVHLIADTYATALGDSEGTDAYGSIELQDDDGNGIWRRTVYINVNEGENTSFNYIFKLIPIEQINAPLAIARVFGLLPNCWPCHIILAPDIVMMPIPPIIANRFILFHKRLLRKLIHQLDQFHLQLLQY